MMSACLEGLGAGRRRERKVRDMLNVHGLHLQHQSVHGHPPNLGLAAYVPSHPITSHRITRQPELVEVVLEDGS